MKEPFLNLWFSVAKDSYGENDHTGNPIFGKFLTLPLGKWVFFIIISYERVFV